MKENRKQILMVFNEIPYPPVHGGSLRVLNLLKELSKYYEVTLLTLPNKRGNFDLKELEKVCKVILAPCFVEEFFKKPRFISYFTRAAYFKFERLFSPFKSKLVMNHNYQAFCLNKALKKILNEKKFYYIQAEHSYLGNAVDEIKSKAVKILDFHNVHSYMKNNPREISLIRKYERVLASKFDLAICCSEIDKKRLESLGYKKILVVPNGADTEYFRKVPYSKPSSLLFVGDMTYWPNKEGINYFFNEVYPLLSPDIRINLIGKYKREDFNEKRKLKNVRFLGFVEDIRPYLIGSVFICPLLNGGGTRLKILTAFSSGVPVVSTSKGAEGIEYKDNVNILIADDPESFAKRIIELLNEPKKTDRIRKNSRRLAESKYKWGKIVKKYCQELEQMKNEKE